MDIKKFKKLIKETVIDALNEEMPLLINEALKKYSSKQQRINESNLLDNYEEFNFESSDVLKKSNLPLNIRKELFSKIGGNFNKPNELKIINEHDEEGNKVNPYLEFIKDSAQNLTPQDIAGIKNLDM